MFVCLKFNFTEETISVKSRILEGAGKFKVVAFNVTFNMGGKIDKFIKRSYAVS